MTTLRRLALLSALAITAISPAMGQYRFEVHPFAGYQFGGEVPVGPNEFSFDPIQFRNSVTAGVAAGLNITNFFGVEFLWNRQPTNAVALTPAGPFPERIEITLDQFHGNLLFNFRDEDAKLRPFLLMGAGATRGSGPGDAETRFSFGIGGGIKYFFHPNIGLRVQDRYSPTYLYSTPGGVWCDWWGFCWVVPNDVYIQQGSATAGLVFRF